MKTPRRTAQTDLGLLERDAPKMERRTWKCCRCHETNYDTESMSCSACGHSKCGKCPFQM